MIALINAQIYNLNSYYTEQTSGKLHLYIENSQAYDLDDLESNIQQSEDIKIYNYSLEEEPTAILRGYTLIRHLEKQYDMNNQIYVAIDVESFQTLLNQLTGEVEVLRNTLVTLQETNSGYDTAIQDLNSNIQNLSSRIATLEDKVSNLENTPEPENTPAEPDLEINPVQE